MGVMECVRLDCITILCTRYSYEYGYICDGCFADLVMSGEDTDIEGFLNSEAWEIDVSTSRIYFDQVFKGVYDD